jgi:error-prone DNA polymerase
MLTAVRKAIDLVNDWDRRNGGAGDVQFHTIPDDDPAVYDMLCKADSVGVFQVESRAQMATLPRLRPRTFSELVIEVAIIRPGPIQGGSVHPYIRRKNGQEEITYLHPLLEKPLRKTYGVPLFQEQLMQIAIDVAGFSPAEADELRVAMGAKRSKQRMERLHDRLCAGMAAKGVSADVAEQIYAKLIAFANFGFPESHAVSFAFLVYASAWLKLHHPAAFLAGLLNAQPMGFYSPQSLVADARRHGVVVHGPDVNLSRAKAFVQSDGAVRLGLVAVRGIGEEVARRLAEDRDARGFSSMAQAVRTGALTVGQLEALATAGAFGSLGLDRRAALWAAGAFTGSRPGHLEEVVVGTQAPPLPALTDVERAAGEIWALGLTPDTHVTAFARATLDAAGAVCARDLRTVPDGTRVVVGGAVIHRQRPGTAGGTTFVNLEDESGHINVICSRGVWARYRRVARTAPGLLIRGRVENAEGVVNVIADKIEALVLRGPSRSRDFH